MRAWIYHLPIGQLGALGEMIGAAGFGFVLAAAVVIVWRRLLLEAGAPARARRDLLALDSLSGEPVPVPGVRRGGGGDRAGAAGVDAHRSTGAWPSCSPVSSNTRRPNDG